MNNPKTLAQSIEEVHVKRLKLSWDTVNDAVEALEYMVSPYSPKLIVGVSRGGLIPAVLLSHRLNVPLAVITASAYEGTRRTIQKPIVIDGWKPEYDSCNTVVVDDIMDSGDTYAKLFNMGGNRVHPEWKFATIVNKSCRRFAHPLFFAQVPKDVWVQFPWEQEES